MKLIGITGGIGMGKSTTARLLAERGVPVVDTDDLARQLVEPGQPALEEIRSKFGPKVIDPAGRLDRAQLASVVFASPESRRHLESILHPRIRAAWEQTANQWRADGRPLGAIVIPLLFETGAATAFDRIICTACQPATQRRRLAERGWSAAEIDGRLAAQWDAARKAEAAHHVIWTEPAPAVHAAQLDSLLDSISRAPQVRRWPASTLIVHPDSRVLARDAADRFVAAARRGIRERGHSALVLAGGSTPRAVYSLLAADYSNELPWDKVHLFFGDERHVPPDDAQSNYRMVRETLLANPAIRDRAQIHRIEAELPAAVAADRYEDTLRRILPSAPGTQPTFDLVLLGMGADGHTASLFPGTQALQETVRTVVANEVPQLKTWRITLTFPALAAAREVLFLTAGADKADMLERILRPVSGEPAYPCQQVRAASGPPLWLTDLPAAKPLLRQAPPVPPSAPV